MVCGLVGGGVLLGVVDDVLVLLLCSGWRADECGVMGVGVDARGLGCVLCIAKHSCIVLL